MQLLRGLLLFTSVHSRILQDSSGDQAPGSAEKRIAPAGSSEESVSAQVSKHRVTMVSCLVEVSSLRDEHVFGGSSDIG